MAPLKNKELEAENARLKREIVEIKADKTNESALQDMVKIAHLNGEIECLKAELAEISKSLEIKSEELRKAGKQSPRKISDVNKIKNLEKKVVELEEKLIEKDEYIEQLHEITLKKNSRKVGRKSKATDENIIEITRLHNEGHSYSQIAKHITENTGEKISKSTVANIVHKLNLHGQK
jgi:predicted RNase H-like nuclease (RuvC/YqgF family)